ncbi:hypothetical protein PSPO01_07990 [Paraphaeosphaeria sporulosa]
MELPLPKLSFSWSHRTLRLQAMKNFPQIPQIQMVLRATQVAWRDVQNVGGACSSAVSMPPVR